MNNAYPIGEKILVRHDLNRRGGLYYLREITIAVILSSIILPLAISFSLIAYQLNSVNSPILLTIAVCTAMLLLYINLLKHNIATLYSTANCPQWIYSEQLDPIKLTIHYLFRPSKSLNLAFSTLKHTHRIKYYTTLTITDQATETSATLGLLTPEEYDRFMQYWNAANPPASTKDQE